MNATPEQWLPVAGYEGLYEVSDQGRVRGIDRVIRHKNGVSRHQRGQFLAVRNNPDGYRLVTLWKNNRQQTCRVHRLVLDSFVGICPPGLQGCHNNDVKHDNRLENLRWDTGSANELDKIRNGNNWKANISRCPKNHPYDDANTCRSGGKRYCRACAREKAQRRRLGK